MKTIILILCAFLFPIAASANVMTFVDVPPNGVSSDPYIEDGITATNASYYGSPGSAHLDSNATQFTIPIAFSMNRNFNADSFDFSSGGFGYLRQEDDGTKTEYFELTYDNIEVIGNREGVEVANSRFQMGDSTSTYFLNSDFQNLDELLISVIMPYTGDGLSTPSLYIYFFCYQECSHGNLDNVVLTPVPLPAGLPLFGAGLLLVGWTVKRRQRRR